MTFRIAVFHDGFVPIYRARFFEILNTSSEHEYVVFHGDAPSDSGHTCAAEPLNFPNVRSRNLEIQLGGRTLVYEPVMRRVLSGGFDAIVVGHEVKFVSSMLLFALFRVMRKPALLWGHGYHRASDSSLARFLSSPIARLADGYLAYTEGGAAKLRAAGVDASRIVVVRNTLDMAEQRASQARIAHVDPSVLRAALGLERNGQTLLYIGRLSRRKRVNDAIEIVRRLNEESRESGPIQLLIVGDGPERKTLEAQAAGRSDIIFLGPIHDPDGVARLMRITAAVVIPGTVGLAINHAFAHGVPLITTDHAFHSPEVEYLEHGVNGLMVSGGVDALVARVRLFLADLEEQRRLCEGARRAAAGLTLDHSVREFDAGVVAAIRRRQECRAS
jgi:glycosyltransferase involved in cell wall biosynthesis